MEHLLGVLVLSSDALRIALHFDFQVMLTLIRAGVATTT
jgi:hypothetical protein